MEMFDNEMSLHLSNDNIPLRISLQNTWHE